MHTTLAHELGGARRRDRGEHPLRLPGAVPRCYQEALRALDVRQNPRQRSETTTFFDDLGRYRILGPGNDARELEGFVRQSLGQLIDYDDAAAAPEGPPQRPALPTAAHS
ncbi:hypothetical protein [Streptomyces shenzhenensis]|uniref:hypothetical protein n=1 Tax=Streptomyces shenzhenensis TaxID=943815 RepID=UPI003F53EFB7